VTDLLHALRDDVPRMVRLCTPSILLEQEWLANVLASDVSVSYSRLGSLIGHTGTFACIAELIARLHGAQRALVVTSGSTGANKVALSAHARVAGDGIVLVDRQCHHSVPAALTEMAIDWAYLSGGRDWDATWEAPAPLSAAAVRDALRRHGRVASIVVTSPTYAGECADLPAIVAAVRKHSDALVHVDQAWGSHLPWLPQLRDFAAMPAGADTASISIHKQAGCVQPGAAVLADTARIPGDVLDAAYAAEMSTSQSLPIVASIESSQTFLDTHGLECFAGLERRAALLAMRLRTLAPGLRFLADERPGPHDPTKVTFRLDGYQIGGYALADALEQAGIVPEKASPATLTFLVTLAATDREIERAASTTAALLEEAGPRTSPLTRLADPYRLCSARPTVSPTAAMRAAHRRGVVVPAATSVGQIAAERIEAYPPGTAVVFEGFRIDATALDWLRSVRDAGGRIIARDPSLETVRILPPADRQRPAREFAEWDQWMRRPAVVSERSTASGVSAAARRGRQRG
jgi:arginine/lysine/ornithine decarboxylase